MTIDFNSSPTSCDTYGFTYATACVGGDTYEYVQNWVAVTSDNISKWLPSTGKVYFARSNAGQPGSTGLDYGTVAKIKNDIGFINGPSTEIFPTRGIMYATSVTADSGDVQELWDDGATCRLVIENNSLVGPGGGNSGLGSTSDFGVLEYLSDFVFNNDASDWSDVIKSSDGKDIGTVYINIRRERQEGDPPSQDETLETLAFNFFAIRVKTFGAATVDSLPTYNLWTKNPIFGTPTPALEKHLGKECVFDVKPHGPMIKGEKGPTGDSYFISGDNLSLNGSRLIGYFGVTSDGREIIGIPLLDSLSKRSMSGGGASLLVDKYAYMPPGNTGTYQYPDPFQLDANAGNIQYFEYNNGITTDGIELVNFKQDDEVTLILKRKNLNGPQFNSVFYDTSGSPANILYETGITYKTGNKVNDVDLFSIYCLEEDLFLVNHVQYHDGIDI